MRQGAEARRGPGVNTEGSDTPSLSKQGQGNGPLSDVLASVS